MARFLIASWDGGGNTPPAYHLGAALVTIGDHLAPTALRVAATDHQLTLALRPGALPEPLRECFDAEQSLRHSLDTSTAVELLKLVRDKILAPFPDDGRFPGEEKRPTRGHTWTEEFLISFRIAIDAEPQGGDPGTPVVEIHPDVMFALRLTGRPADPNS